MHHVGLFFGGGAVWTRVGGFLHVTKFCYLCEYVVSFEKKMNGS